MGLNRVSSIQSHSYLPKTLPSLSPDMGFQLGKLHHVPLMVTPTDLMVSGKAEVVPSHTLWRSLLMPRVDQRSAFQF